ncbi:MAG: alpha/beta fold hydrolase [Bacteroidales bacterium]|nr:alpha/beta fold hydrolase [Bacteroidales bacterium]
MDLVYHTPEREYSKGEKVIWICHALTGNSDPEDWWPQMVGKGTLIDVDKYYVVCVSMICSSYGECSPATIDPATGKPYLLSFPDTTIRDMVRANILVRKHLGIEKIDLMIGPSIGGFLTYEWAVMEPEVIKNAFFLATANRVPPFLTAFNESQRMAMLADPTFKEAKDIHGGELGLKCARSIALISYRTCDGYNTTQSEKDDDIMVADRASSYQRYQGEKLIRREFDAYSYWYLSYALDSMNLGRGRGGVEAALSTIKAKSIVVSITSDMLFPPSLGAASAAAIPGAVHKQISSIYGHDGFLIENDQLCDILAPVIDTL